MSTTPELSVLHRAIVGDDEIDELGHMNVRFYLSKALRATDELAARHGLSPDACAALGGDVELSDLYTRHHREQLAGAQLVVVGGVLAVRPDGVRFYHELRNPARDECAATFVHELALRDWETRAPRPLPENVAKSAGSALVDWPEYGRPRSIDLDAGPPPLSLAGARERGIAMRAERAVLAEECGPDGRFIPSRYQDMVWGGDPVEPRRTGGWLHDTEDGGKMGWATLESRGVLLELPRAGTCIQSFGAEVELSAKVSYRHQWVFDVASGALLCTSSTVNLAFDIGARRAIEIPSAVRRMLETQYHPDLR
jgi:acyl-CoA thioester hydrolase